MNRYAFPYREALRNYFQRLDWPLLIFLVLFLNVKLYIKIAAILLAILLHGRPVAPRGRIPLWWGFYIAMILLALINFLLSLPTLSIPSLCAFGLGCVYWLLAMTAAWQVFSFVQGSDREKIHTTVSLFFLLNAGIMLLSLIRICLEAGALNPYNYEGHHRKYFISTGDMISGIGLDSSVTAALISAFAVLYFLYRGRRDLSLLCFATTLLATSNTVNYLLLIVLTFCFFFYSDRLQKSMILIFFIGGVIFSAKVSPSNQQYSRNLLGRLAGKNAYVEPVPILHARWDQFVESKPVAAKETKLQHFMDQTYPPDKVDSIKRQYKGWDLSGRRIAWEELRRFFQKHPARLLLGTGMGNFSSQLALRTTGLGVQGAYPEKQAYIHPFFRDNYLFLYLYYHTRDEGQHSVINKPDSVYGQLLSEYGLIGLALFFIFYLAFFGRVFRLRAGKGAERNYGLPLLLMMLGAFFTEYWFEQLSVVILFELIMLLEKEHAP
ncbi:MAG: O-antigen ligase family protein [Chitinophagaceae bacterium]|nr:O-antigen ligase family protein [Chitinophagaceae bacterium]